ncbi:MAG: PDZ domain-containing protein [Rhodanobacteraceae bacterium]|jgi:membrane-associated protease RseP (regulator of RpoE activity)|nr:PDZ domain-containing protein [Rhodanobacteraceae bacterium]
MKLRHAAVALLLLGGCATLPPPTPPGAPPAAPSIPGVRYEAEPGRDAATIAALRAAPPPAQPELAPGTTPLGDHNRLAAQGYVRIGRALLHGSEAEARADALRQSQQVGADRVALYAPGTDPAAPREDWLAIYYVRFQLPFGATFRDLRADERATLGAAGGVQIGSVIGGTPAARANLRPGDFVLALDGQPVADRAAFQALLKRHAGHGVTLTIVRNGETLQRVVRLGVMAAAER